jgi:hypothetical protein
MLIPYPYNPATQDLWLYEPITISWTFPSQGSATVYRPYAWNPNSLLYGYRKSLRGLTARLRVFGNSNLDPTFFPYNDPNDPVNKPVYYNSFPMSQKVIASRFMHMCAHCYTATGLSVRDPNKRLVDAGSGGHYPANGYFDALLSESFRWLDSDNSLIQHIDPQDIIGPYNSDPAVLDAFAFGLDFTMLETSFDLLAPAVTYVDARTLPLGSTAWMLDSNHKIVRYAFRSQRVLSSVLEQTESFDAAVNPDGTPCAISPIIFLHDSGTHFLVEVSPPTSAQAGDGVLGFITEEISSAAWVTVMGEGLIANTPPLKDYKVLSYLALRGETVSLAQARNQGPYASQTTEQQILSTLQGIPI